MGDFELLPPTLTFDLWIVLVSLRSNQHVKDEYNQQLFWSEVIIQTDGHTHTHARKHARTHRYTGLTYLFKRLYEILIISKKTSKVQNFSQEIEEIIKGVNTGNKPPT